MRKILKGVGGRIKRLRTAKNLSQVKFGELIGVTNTHVYLMEKSLRMPSTSLLCLIGYKFEVSEDWLFSGKGEMLSKKGKLVGVK